MATCEAERDNRPLVVDSDKRRQVEEESKKPKIATTGSLIVCALTLCESGFDEEDDPEWDPGPRRSARCVGRCSEHDVWCCLREFHGGDHQCRRCVMQVPQCVFMTLSQLEADLDGGVSETMFHTSKEYRLHYDYYTGEPLDE